MAFTLTMHRIVANHKRVFDEKVRSQRQGQSEYAMRLSTFEKALFGHFIDKKRFNFDH